MPIPASGASSPLRRVSNWAEKSPSTDRPLIVPPTELSVSKRPQNVPNKPRNIRSPIRYREMSRDSSSREKMLSKMERMDSAESETRPGRSLNIVAIGAKRIGLRCTERPGSARR